MSATDRIRSDCTTRTILVVGATGLQGRAFIGASLSDTASTEAGQIRILALTRSASSPTACSLAKKYGERLEIVTADLDKPDSLRLVFEGAKAQGGLWGVFVVLAYPGLGADATGEENQGKLVADLAHEHGVPHLIYSSSERGGEGFDLQTKLSVRAKVNIEQHIKSLGGLRWTLLRPVFFTENFEGTVGRITTTVIRVGLRPDTKLELVAADDIGHVAHAVFQNSDAFAGKAVAVIGDALTASEIAESYKRGTGSIMPAVPDFLGSTLLAINKHTKALIADIERVYETRASLPESSEDLIQQCKALYPCKTFEEWASARAGRTGNTEPPSGWNKVSIAKLFKGGS